jgi:hypothetical protein
MASVDRDCECVRARLYYCDLLSPDHKNAVPEAVWKLWPTVLTARAKQSEV